MYVMLFDVFFHWKGALILLVEPHAVCTTNAPRINNIYDYNDFNNQNITVRLVQ